jgi:hypothetical protein
MDQGQLQVAQHDLYFTTGETVGAATALFPDCGLPWIHIRTPVCLEVWPYTYDHGNAAFTTISTWWAHEWITDGKETYENNKRVSFQEFMELPNQVSQVLELALNLSQNNATSRTGD